IMFNSCGVKIRMGKKLSPAMGHAGLIPIQHTYTVLIQGNTFCQYHHIRTHGASKRVFRACKKLRGGLAWGVNPHIVGGLNPSGVPLGNWGILEDPCWIGWLEV